MRRRAARTSGGPTPGSSPPEAIKPFLDVLAETLASSAAIAIENARLFSNLRERTEELQVRNEELDAFAHTVAHDLKTPLALVMGFGEMLRDSYDLLQPQEIEMYLSHIIDNSTRMNHIIEALLLLAGVRGMQAVTVDAVDMSDIDYEEALRRESALLAQAARVDLDAGVEHCPEWRVADLVAHVLVVHDFWRHNAAGDPAAPDAYQPPEMPDGVALVDAFERGADETVRTIYAIDAATPMWSWSRQQDAGFAHRAGIDHDTADVGATGQVVHRVEQHFLEDRP